MIFPTFAPMKRILIVDDERDLCDILSFNLRASGYNITIAVSAEEALGKIGAANEGGNEPFDLLLLDVMMDGMSGFELARRLNGRIPIIFLTAKDTEDDLLKGFQLGADDYIAKPFSIREVKARIQAVLNRTSTGHEDTLVCDDLIVNQNDKRVTIDGEEVALTRTEFELLALFLTEQGRLFSRQQLIERIWPRDVIVTDRTVDVNITRLRKKMGRYASCIVTRQGYGYCFEKL